MWGTLEKASTQQMQLATYVRYEEGKTAKSIIIVFKLKM